MALNHLFKRITAPIEHKSIEGKQATISESGEFEAVFATLGVIDHDNDMIIKGAFEGNGVVPVQPAHDVHAVPIGKGMIVETENEARIIGRLNLNTTSGRDWHAHLKFDADNPPATQEWSFGFKVLDSENTEIDGQQVRLIKRVKVFEVSPVLVGAGINTRTVAVKQLARARRPKFNGTETTPWSAPTMDDYKRAFDGDTDFANIGDAPASFKRFVADHTLLGDPDGSTLREVSLFPVVRPSTGKLNANALRAVLGGRGAQADIPESALESARAMARRLLDSEFDKSLDAEIEYVRFLSILNGICLSNADRGGE